ncbi:hypothetical protein HHK36_023962 [Tetracentron sinense]|uniref:Protein kinase domain-containing protein n=1 Tax=Tetracentron sinense TaxID=13715 RepID=A0A834YP24_TETSI|nr:hypothetical protein HHK36_023962 [Tetracentron sinense]
MRPGRDFNMFLLWLMYITTIPLFAGVCMGGELPLPGTESLINFIRAVDPKNILRSSWNGSKSDPCLDKWMGIKCDLQTHNIREIRLENLNLSGTIDADSLCKLPFLRVLSLAKNLIRGSIPDGISNCKSLVHLNLSSNLLHGRLPASLTNLKNLQSLDISNNNFSGTIPKFKQELKYFYLSMKSSTLEMTPNRTNNMKKLMKESSTISNSPNITKPHTEGQKTNAEWKQWIPLLLGIAFFILFIFFVNKKAKTVRDNEILQTLEDASFNIPAVKAGDEMKLEEEHSELVFFVEEDERFKIEDLLESAAELQGQSLCSSLYKVKLKNNTIFAAKRLKKLQVSFEEFSHTMRQIGNLKHPNILPLVAYHSSNEEKLLIYKYQWNGNLLTLLENYAEGKRDFPWRLRLSIASGIARGLDFMYRRSGGRERIPHGNIKLSNILLNENEEPLISEYGFQRFLDPKKECLYSSNGYRAPEKRLTEQADVFSFGIILLELLTGKTVERSGLDLPKWVKSMVREEWTGEVFDKEVNKAGKQWAFPLLNISLKCVSHFPEKRPNITEVLHKIEEVMNAQEDFSFSSVSSMESNQQDCCILHSVIPETWETPGSNH